MSVFVFYCINTVAIDIDIKFTNYNTDTSAIHI